MTAVVDMERLEAQNKPTKIESLSQAAQVFWRNASPWVITVAILGAWSTRVVLGQWTWWDMLIGASVLLFWPMQEWLIHVFVLHFKPRTILGKKVDMHVAHMHRVHHQVPWVLEYVFVPARTELTTLFVGIPVFLGVWWMVGLPLQVGLTAVAVFSTFGLVYEWTHFLVHTNYRPKSKLYKRIWQNHRWHHFKNENYWFGVSRLEADALLRTSPDPKDVPTSPTCRTLGIGEQGEQA